MKRQIRFGNSVLSYNVVKTKRRKTSEIRVDENGIEVRTPIVKKDSEIKRMIENKKQWIFKKQLEFNERKYQKTRTRHSKSFLLNRIEFFSYKIGVQPQGVVLKKLKTRWGSLTKDKTLNFNMNLLKAPSAIIDYVIVHELCHFKIKEHSYRYWNLVRRFMPDYEYQKRWLEIHGMDIL